MQGPAVDNLSGVDRVLVAYAPVGGKGPTVTFEVDVADAGTEVVWAAPVPARRGTYTVSAVAVDHAGNVDPTPATGQAVVA